jgi:hypothetical protein
MIILTTIELSLTRLYVPRFLITYFYLSRKPLQLTLASQLALPGIIIPIGYRWSDDQVGNQPICPSVYLLRRWGVKNRPSRASESPIGLFLCLA